MPDYVIHIIAYICGSGIAFALGWHCRRRWAQKRWHKDGVSTLTVANSASVNFEPGMLLTVGDTHGEEMSDA